MIQIPIAIATCRAEPVFSIETRLPIIEVSDRGELESFLELNQPRCLFLDSEFPGVDVSAVISASRQNRVSTIVLCRNGDTNSVIEYFRAGALDVLETEGQSEEAVECQVSEILERSSQACQEYENGKNLGDLVKLARHDLKAPLRTIAGFSKLLMQSIGQRLSGEDREYLEFINSSANKGYQLLERLKVFAEIPPAASCDPVSLEGVALLASNVKSVRDGAGEVSIDWKSAPEVYGNEADLVCLFSELIDNSLKFNRSSAPRVAISSEREGGYWQIIVKDNGIGIDESHWQKVFDPLCRLNSDSEYAGCGMGLSISKRIVESHGGLIDLKSSAERGSEVSFGLIALN